MIERTPAARQVRWPKGYRGLGHKTLGSDVLALSETVRLPELLFDKESAEALRLVQPSAWYPIQMLLEPLERLDAVLGPSALRKIGVELFRLTHEAAFRSEASSARDIVYGIDGMYRRANRGIDIGGWEVLRFEPGAAALEKTTPHHCVMEEGILEAAFKALGLPAVIYQARCVRKGDQACEYHITSHVSDERWTGAKRSSR